MTFTLLSHSHCWHSYIWLSTGVIRTFVFQTLVVQAVSFFALPNNGELLRRRLAINWHVAHQHQKHHRGKGGDKVSIKLYVRNNAVASPLGIIIMDQLNYQTIHAGTCHIQLFRRLAAVHAYSMMCGSSTTCGHSSKKKPGEHGRSIDIQTCSHVIAFLALVAGLFLAGSEVVHHLQFASFDTAHCCWRYPPWRSRSATGHEELNGDPNLRQKHPLFTMSLLSRETWTPASWSSNLTPAEAPSLTCGSSTKR